MNIPFNSNQAILTAQMLDLAGAGDDATVTVVAPFQCRVRYLSIGHTAAPNADINITVTGKDGQNFTGLTIANGQSDSVRTEVEFGTFEDGDENCFGCGQSIIIVSDGGGTTGGVGGVLVLVEAV